jgi:hypothetical protein
MRLWLLITALALASAHGLAGGVTAAGCAKSAPPALTSASTRTELVPPGATAVLLCRYRGLNPAATAHRLVRGKLVTNAAEVKRFVSELDGLPKLQGRVPCPMDDGSEITANFRYAHSTPVAVTVGLTGCRNVSNGRLTRTADSTTGARLLAQLMRLLP